MERWAPHVPALSLVSPYAAAPNPYGPLGPHLGAIPPAAVYSHHFYRQLAARPGMAPFMKGPLSPTECQDFRRTSIEDLRLKAKHHSAVFSDGQKLSS